MMTCNCLPAKQVRLIIITVLMLASCKEARASFFAGNLSAYSGSNDPCVSRIYRNADEYHTQKGECVGGIQTKMIVTGFLSSSDLKIKTPDNTFKISLDSLWGFRQSEHEFRIFNGRVYQILANDSVVIYRGIGKYYRKYYFSQGIDGAVHWFSKKKLKTVLSEHKGFIKVLDDGFPVHKLLQYDDCDHKFLIHRLLTENSP